MVEEVCVFHQVFQFLGILGIEDRIIATAPLAAQSCEASQNAGLWRKIFRIRHSEKPLQYGAKSLRNMPAISRRPVSEVRPKQSVIAVVLGHRVVTHVPS